jgi:hypothetical protein
MTIYRKRGRNRSWRSEDYTPPPKDPQTGNCFYFDIYGAELDSPITQGKPWCICHPLLFWNLSHLLDALGDRSCVLNQLLHFVPWIWLLPLNPLIYKKVFLMLSFALEKQNVLFWQKMMLQSGWTVFKNKTWWWIHHGHDGFNIGKDVPLPGTKLWVKWYSWDRAGDLHEKRVSV